jgi:hypothetical protein
MGNHARTEDGGAKLNPLCDVRYGPNQVRWALRRLEALEQRVKELEAMLAPKPGRYRP